MVEMFPKNIRGLCHCHSKFTKGMSLHQRPKCQKNKLPLTLRFYTPPIFHKKEQLLFCDQKKIEAKPNSWQPFCVFVKGGFLDFGWP